MYHRGGPPDDWRDRRNNGPRMGDGPRGPPPGPGGWRGGPPPPQMGGPPPQAEPQEEINREKTCPLLLRVFPRQGAHHQLKDFDDASALPEELAIYTWMDADLRELGELIQDVQPAARGRNARISFAFIYPDRRGRNVMRQVGVVHAGRAGEDDRKTLRSLSFQAGDYLDVAIY